VWDGFPDSFDSYISFEQPMIYAPVTLFRYDNVLELEDPQEATSVATGNQVISALAMAGLLAISTLFNI
jgi:hypothetical protein